MTKDKQIKVLLAEDQKDLQLLMSKYLEQMGYDYSIASNGQEVIEKVSKQSYSLILMDLRMPIMDGLEVTTRLRAGGYEGPIIGLSAHSTNEQKQEALRVGMSGYLIKPIRFQELKNNLEKWLDQ